MRLFCWICGKSVSSDVTKDVTIRAILICPECIEMGKIKFMEREPHQLRLPFDNDEE